MPRIRTPLLICLLIAACAAIPAEAKIPIAIGIGDQNGALFGQKNFKAVHVKKVRYYIRWDAIKFKKDLRDADRYVALARKAHVRVLMHVSTNDYRHRKAKLPSVAQYRKYVGKLVKRYKAKGVKEWGAWNEENHISEPTYRSPTRAAQFFHAMRGLCRGCTIVALDLLDQANSASYAKRFYRALSASDRSAARIIGIHNYEDTNRFRDHGTKTIINAVRRQNSRAQFWLTETGGIVKLGKNFPCSTSRAARAVKYMFKLTKKYRRYIKRVYTYRWFGTQPKCQFFDAGLVNANGSARPGYKVFKRYAAGYAR